MFIQNQFIMLKDIIDILKDISLRHKGVRTFKYQDKVYNNAQNNHETYQVYVDTASLHQLNITTGIFKAEFQMYVLSQPDGTSGNTILDVQNNAYTIAVNILAKIDTDEVYTGILSVYDYSILTLSHYTDDNAAGVKLSIVLEMPSPLNWCTLDENFNDEPYSGDTDTEITISGVTEVNDIDITPIKLPKNRNC